MTPITLMYHQGLRWKVPVDYAFIFALCFLGWLAFAGTGFLFDVSYNPDQEPQVFWTKQELHEQIKSTKKRYKVEISPPYDKKDVEAMVKIAMRESSLNHLAKNPNSTAFGLYQFLDSTWQSTGIKKTKDPLLQTKAALRYTQARYGGQKEALDYHKRKGHY